MRRTALLATFLLLLAGCGSSGARAVAVMAPAAAATRPAMPATAAQRVVTAVPAAAVAPPPVGMAPPATATPVAKASSSIRLLDAASGFPIPCPAAQVNGVTLRAMDGDGGCAFAGGTGAGTITATGYEPAAVPAASAAIALVPTPEAVAGAYLQALQAQHWAAMWQLTHPLGRARWSGEPAFAAFLAAKFAPGGHTSVAAVSVGTSQSLATWNDVRFTGAPQSAVRVPAQVKLGADAPYASPPNDPTLQRPLVLVRDGKLWKVADGGPADLQGPVLVPSRPVMRTLRVPIMMYHHVAPAPQRTPQMGDFDYRLAVDLTVTPDQFSQQLDWLVAHSYQTISPQQLLAALYDGVALPAHPIILTFDDGYLDNAQYAAPALMQRHMLGTFNIVTGLVGQTGGPLQYMSWQQIADLAASGLQIESHTVSHRDLGILSAADDVAELTGSRAALAEHLGEAPQFICYPSGEPFRSGTAEAQRRLLRLVPQAGYVGGFLDPRLAGAVQRSDAPYQLPRIRVPGEATLSQFAASIEDQIGP